MSDILDSVKKKLEGKNPEYICLGVTDDGSKRISISIPWERTVTAMNMKLPNVYLSVEEIMNPEVIRYLSENTRVISCYTFVPLENYEFLAAFPEIIDLEIRYGINIKSLSFMKNMKSWNMLYLQDAHLKDLKDIFPENGEKRFGLCLALLVCEVEDITALTDSNYNLSELIIFRGKAQSGEQNRWKKVRSSTYRYYTLDKE